MEQHRKAGRRLTSAAVVVLALWAVGSTDVAVAEDAETPDADAPVALNSGEAGPKGCVSWETRSVFTGADFDHSISLTSKCAAPIRCAIQPSIGEALSATVAPNKTEHVLIWRGSPAREVSAEVTCEAAR
jgi:hypothetical protein